MSRRRHKSCSSASLLIVVLCAPLAVRAADDIVQSTDVMTDPDPLVKLNRLKPEEIDKAGAVIGKVIITPQNIFDMDNPLEDKWLYRLANKLHIVTKPHVVESQLLFEEGDKYSLRLSDESERILRRNRYLNDADIRPIAYEDGVVDLEVITEDVWTLTPEFSLGRSGGENSFGIGLLEQNLLRPRYTGRRFLQVGCRPRLGVPRIYRYQLHTGPLSLQRQLCKQQ